MMYPTKTALVIRYDLSPWQLANVAAFLSGGLAGAYPEIVGEAYRDGDGRLYAPMIREPIFIYGASSAELMAVLSAEESALPSTRCHYSRQPMTPTTEPCRGHSDRGA